MRFHFVHRLSPRAILVIGWIGFAIYAFPGYMSADSVAQLLESRAGFYSDGHPPAMAALWRLVELVIAGPVGMLIVQSTCFLIGVYLLFARRMSKRAAAVAACLVLLYPMIGATIAVIWKDSQMSGFLVLGTALVLGERRRTRVAGLVLLAAATAMRHNALAMTLPIIGLLFAWNPAYRWWKRYPIAIAAWIAVTLSAQTVNRLLTDKETFIWHQSLALLDIVGTLHHVEPDIPDAELRRLFEGIRVVPARDLHRATRPPHAPDANMVDVLWSATNRFFKRPTTRAERDAIVRAWRAVVFDHPGAYLAYRWQVFRQLLQLTDLPLQSPAYIWFSDTQNYYGSVAKIDHDAYPSGIQIELREWMVEIGASWMFHVYVYLFLGLALVPFCVRDREAFAVLASAFTGQAALFFLAPTTDLRYSFWLILGVVLAAVMITARRVNDARSRA